MAMPFICYFADSPVIVNEKPAMNLGVQPDVKPELDLRELTFLDRLNEGPKQNSNSFTLSE